jgi:hypothetical protein
MKQDAETIQPTTSINAFENPTLGEDASYAVAT